MSLEDERRTDDEDAAPRVGGGDEPAMIPLEEPSEPEEAPPPPAEEIAPPPVKEPPAPEPKAPAKAEGDDAPLVRPGLGGPKAALIVGAALLVGAMIAAAVRVSGLEGARFSDATLAVFYVLYMTLLHSLTGFAALLIAARVAGRELGKAELGAARMLVAVAAFALVANLNIPIPTRADEVLLALAAYTLIVWGANRLTRLELGVVVIAHAIILVIVGLGSVLDSAYSDARSELGPPTQSVPADDAPPPPGGEGAP